MPVLFQEKKTFLLLLSIRSGHWGVGGGVKPTSFSYAWQPLVPMWDPGNTYFVLQFDVNSGPYIGTMTRVCPSPKHFQSILRRCISTVSVLLSLVLVVICLLHSALYVFTFVPGDVGIQQPCCFLFYWPIYLKSAWGHFYCAVPLRVECRGGGGGVPPFSFGWLAS